jgi:hypothetical protein
MRLVEGPFGTTLGLFLYARASVVSREEEVKLMKERQRDVVEDILWGDTR